MASVQKSIGRVLCHAFLLASAAGVGLHYFPIPCEAGTPFSLARSMLTAHNNVRTKVKDPPLEWSDKLAAHAQEWANTLLSRREFFHRPDSRYGENLFEIRGASAQPAEVVRAWASEERNYNYGTNSCRGVCGHYTQIVWRSTRKLGCAVARGGGREVWVCNYDPPGNWVGKWPY